MNEQRATPTFVGRSADEMRRVLQTAPQLCPVCRYVAATLSQHIDTLFFERVNDIATRAAIREAGGFCRRHAQLVARQADALGTALICQDLLTNELRSVEGGELDRPPETTRGISRLFDGSSRGKPVRTPCPLCQTERSFEETALDSLFQALADRAFADLFRRSSGLCLPHFRLGFDRCQDEGIWRTVLETEKAALRSLVAELGELARKSDYRFRDEPLGGESDSWRRALNMTSGLTEG